MRRNPRDLQRYSAGLGNYLDVLTAEVTVLAQRPGRPWTLVSHNDLSHLPMELRTGLPEVPPI